jgi:RHS repeat-associated protein
LLQARSLPTPRTHWRKRRAVRRGTSGRSFYNYFRDYDPAIGRYVESDPIGLEGGLNTYAYVGNNPLMYADPTGESAASLALTAPSAGAGGAGAGGAGVAGAAAAAGAVVGAGAVGVGVGLGINKGIEWIFDRPLGVLIYEMCNEDRERRCDHQYYNVDIPTCRAISRARGPGAGKRCYASASQRYAACLRNQPLPPLDTWNN